MSDVAPAPQESAVNPGVSHGSVVLSPDGAQEKIIHEYGPAGEVVGWHKENA